MKTRTTEDLQADLDANRRSEHRLIRIAIVALVIVGILVVIRLVYFS